jgi:hypothetical protein
MVLEVVSERVFSRTLSQADDGRRGHLELDQRIDADGDQDVVRERDERRDRHAPLEGEGQVDDDGDEEDDQALERLLGDVLAPARADRLRADVVGLGEPELLLHGALHLGHVGRAEALGLHSPAGAGLLHDGVFLDDPGALDRGAGVRGRDVRFAGELEDRAALELDAEVQPEGEQRHDADDQDEARDGVPGLLPPDEVEGDLAAMEAAADITQA